MDMEITGSCTPSAYSHNELASTSLSQAHSRRHCSLLHLALSVLLLCALCVALWRNLRSPPLPRAHGSAPKATAAAAPSDLAAFLADESVTPTWGDAFEDVMSLSDETMDARYGDFMPWFFPCCLVQAELEGKEDTKEHKEEDKNDHLAQTAPVLTEDDITFIRENYVCRRNLTRAWFRLLSFIGFKFDGVRIDVTTSASVKFRERDRLGISRALTSLMTLGLPELAEEFIAVISNMRWARHIDVPTEWYHLWSRAAHQKRA